MTARFARAVERLASAAYSPDKPDETPETTARALWWAAAGDSTGAARVSMSLPDLDAEAADRLDRYIDRRLAGEPLAYLTGRQQFMGRDFLTAPGALIPRRETEILGAAAVELAREAARANPSVRLLDLCTGSGNLAVTLALEIPTAAIIATDLEQDALALASRNAQFHGVEARIRFAKGDLFRALESFDTGNPTFDLVVCNPPYIPSHKARNMPMEVAGHEPAAAFDGGDLGLSVLFRLVGEAPRFLRPGGWLCFELGAGQGRLIEKRLTGNPAYTNVRSLPDSHGTTRAVTAQHAHAH